MTNEQVLKELIIYIKNNNGMTNCFGHFEFKTSDIIGQGGNGVVYSATIDDKSVAIKFLLSTSSKKRRRFKSEFLNTNFVRNFLKQIVNMIHYDELKISDKLSIPYIIMNKYKKSLKTYREEIDSVNISDFNKLSNFLLTSIKSLHNKGILHRDIKPENILIDSDGEYLLSDFGIAHFDEEEFPIDNKTDKGERLANVEFSAPEQLCKDTVVNQTADIYSMAQILYWFVFKTVNRGTGGRHLSEVIKDKDSYIYDILDRDEVYSGCYARVSLNFYAFNSNGNRGVACGLGNIQKIRDGEYLGGRTSATDDFSTVEDDDFLA